MMRLIKFLISAFYWLLLFISRCISKIVGREIPGTCVVLYYHSVRSEHRKKFAWQMKKLIEWSKPLSTCNIKDIESGNQYVIVTFDDGYESLLDNALPELCKYNIPATIFIQTGYIGRHPEWIKDERHALRNEIIMNNDQLKNLRGNNISIGSHGVSHKHLVELAENDAKSELLCSKKQLQSITGSEVKFFSFPHGAYNQQLLKWCHEEGYEKVFTIEPTLLLSGSDEYSIGRFSVEPDDWRLEFLLKLQGAYSWLGTIDHFRHINLTKSKI
jgi:peptidoglycan/xylan/chitin deacetylase (PgdA/CDA1 family)